MEDLMRLTDSLRLWEFGPVDRSVNYLFVFEHESRDKLLTV